MPQEASRMPAPAPRSQTFYIGSYDLLMLGTISRAAGRGYRAKGVLEWPSCGRYPETIRPIFAFFMVRLLTCKRYGVNRAETCVLVHCANHSLANHSPRCVGCSCAGIHSSGIDSSRCKSGER